MVVRFDEKSGWEFHGELFILEEDFRSVYLDRIKEISINKYFKIFTHKVKTIDGKTVTDTVYVADKLKICRHKNGDISVIGNRLFSEVGMTFII